jgi:predicted dehydrogenase
MYRCHPQTARVIELVRDKTIGEVRLIQASFGFTFDYDLSHRALNHDLSGGGILDVGCYCISMSRLIAGLATGKNFAEPDELMAVGHVGAESRVDEYTTAVLKFPGDIIAQVATSVQLHLENVVRIYGTTGYLLIPSPWIVSLDPGTTHIMLYQHGKKEPEEITVEADRGLFTIEADTVAASIANRQATPPAMTWDDTLGNMKALDKWRQAIGLRYDFE